ncbi:hypothetical protein CEXT_137241 [Caerostris extrusa]|uniref:Uncharacterized protein n=1 Tax=Caerostris extrusa TaxID=172846 RepID=A0AAV4Y9J8_CAEEX|nr:hypothetical protein CEXT_137241 [Caerostris extrusa]
MAAELIKLRGFEKAALTRIATFLTTVSSETSIISIKTDFLGSNIYLDYWEEGPMAVIQQIPKTYDSYEEAWTKLMNRYDKKKTNRENLLTTFFSKNSISYVNNSNLRLLADNSEQVVRGLKYVDKGYRARYLDHLHAFKQS